MIQPYLCCLEAMGATAVNSAWQNPLIAFGIAVVTVLVLILLILYFPPVTQLLFGDEGKRVQDVRYTGNRFSAHFEKADRFNSPDLEALPTPGHDSSALPTPRQLITTADW